MQTSKLFYIYNFNIICVRFHVVLHQYATWMSITVVSEGNVDSFLWTSGMIQQWSRIFLTDMLNWLQIKEEMWGKELLEVL